MSKIEWTDITYNPVTGCEKISPGCQNCYAEKMVKRLRYIPHSKEKYRNGFTVTCHKNELERDLGRTPKKIFVCSMSDIFHNAVPWNFTEMILNKIRENPHHIFQLLTKRPNMARAFQEDRQIDWPNNLWFGVTAENQKQFCERVPQLAYIHAKTRFISIEPMLNDVSTVSDIYFTARFLDWVIVGGETGQKARPMNPDWARTIRDQCIEHDIPFFFKQMSKKQRIPIDLMIKEFPK